MSYSYAHHVILKTFNTSSYVLPSICNKLVTM